MTYDPLQAARVRLPNGQVGFDAVKLANIPTEGIHVKDFPNHVIVVRTKNTVYTFVTNGEDIEGVAHKENGGIPSFLFRQAKVQIHGSTWGGSMIKVGYIGVDMRLEFSIPDEGRYGITTSTIQSVQATAINKAAA